MKLVKILLVVTILILVSCSSSKDVVNSNRDASSFNNAVIAKSIAEEYEYVKRVCLECQFLSQSLVFRKNRPYDVLRFRNPSGEEVTYYFDISEFYGKGFD